MPQRGRFLTWLLCGLVALSASAYFGITYAMRGWFLADLSTRSRLAVHAAQRSLVRTWNREGAELGEVLRDITRDERIMGAAACTAQGGTAAITAGYPREYACADLRARTGGAPNSAEVSFRDQLDGGAVYVSVVPVRGSSSLLGEVVLVHDLSYLSGRTSTTRWVVALCFFGLCLAASLYTVLAARFARRAWVHDLRRALWGEGDLRLGGDSADEFLPLLRDVRALAARLAEEVRETERGGTWNPERLRSTLRRFLHDERIIVMANREPYVHERKGAGLEVLHPASGLVTALEPVMRACGGTWVAHGSGSGDRDTVDSHDRVRVPPGEESYALRRVWLSDDEERGYYYGFSNEGLWPLCHLAHTRPVFRADDFKHYAAVNRRFADAVCEEVDSDDPIILVQDYHFALAPRLLRERIPKATIITFWHIPWPNAERMGICPWREELISGLLGSSIIGFHTQQHVNQFLDGVDAFMESRIDREQHAVVQNRQQTLIRPYPISIEWPLRVLRDAEPVEATRAAVRSELGLAPDALLGVGVDRLDYTKGIEERLGAVDALLERHPELRGRFTFVQLAAPSRTKIEGYRQLNERVEALAEAINTRWASGAYRPVVLLRAHHEPKSVVRFYRAAELCYVSSLHDGMNLVAKEFVAARDDETGVLVLSQFTGAARDLTEALIVNPYDLEQASEALFAALSMPRREQRERMRSMRRIVSQFNVYRWAGRMLVDAAELRRHERIVGRLHAHTAPQRAVARA
jgi:trehalose 6-phosphate synthase